jgi:hypothetical protein
MIGICLPSRGLVFSKTIESVFEGIGALKSINLDSEVFMSHDKPIPDCHNFVVSGALKNKDIDTILLMEEDNFLFPQAFVELIQSPFDVTTVQYNDKNGSPHGIIHYNEAGEIIWGGLGSTAVKRKVFESLGEPYFRTDHLYRNIKKKNVNGRLVTDYEEIDATTKWNGKEFVEHRDKYKYGGLDIDFYTRVRKNGFTIGKLENHRGHHFELIKLGEKYTNNGFHEIRQV